MEWLNTTQYANYFEVFRAVNFDGPWSKVAQVEDVRKGTLASFTDSSVVSGADYWYKVRAVNGTAMSDWSNLAYTKAGVIDRERAFGDSLGVNPTGEMGDPVNTLTGGFVTSVRDLSLPGIGLPFSFERSYNSADTTSGKLGVGWTHPFATSLTFPSSSKVKVKGSDGQRMIFTKQPDGSYRGEPGARVNVVSLPGAYEVRHFDGTVERFDTYGQLWQVRDANGNRLSMSWASGNIATITDTVGRSIALGYNASGLLGRVTLPDGRAVTYSYGANGQLETVTDPRGGVTTYSYDGAKRLTKIVDQNGNPVVSNTYNARGRVTEQVDARNAKWIYGWDPNTQTATVTNPRGHRYQDVYRGNVLRRRVDPLGNVTAFDYDADLNLVAVTNAREKQTTMTYDGRGNMLTRTAPTPLGYVDTFTYDSSNRLTSHMDPRGSMTEYVYDAGGLLTKIIRPGNRLTSFESDTSGRGLITSMTDPRGKKTIYGYDAHGNLTSVRMPAGGLTTLEYDQSGRLVALVEARGNLTGANPADFRTRFNYDPIDRVTSMTDPLGNVDSWEYDPAGRLIKHIDAKTRATSYEYNEVNLLKAVVAPDGSRTSYSYDGAGNPVTRTDGNGNVTAYDYDHVNRMIRKTSPTGQVWTYEYNATDSITKTTNPAGNASPEMGVGITTQTYDALERLVSIDYSDQTPDVELAYDPNSNVVSITDGFGIESSVYDASDQLVSVARGADVFSYVYDAGGNVASRTYPDGTIVNLTYDDDSRLASVQSGGATTSYGYDAAGHLTTTTLPTANGHTEERTYDAAGRLVEMVNARGAAVLSRFDYTLDGAGNPRQVVTDDGTSTYEYDALDRLKRVCFQAVCGNAADPFITYEYDAVGNRVTETRPDGVTSYEYDDADQLLKRVAPGDTTVYSHDLNGNLTGAGARAFTYDLENRLVSASTGSGTQTYGYDAYGNRVRASTSSGERRYLWDVNNDMAELVGEVDANNNAVRRYVYGQGVVSMSTPSGAYYYHKDAIGSIADVTDGTGGSQWHYEYEPFGAVRTAAPSSPAAPENPMMFTGAPFDSTSGLYHLRAREYDPALGRFTAEDPVAPRMIDPLTATYAYARNQPMVLHDPSGLVPETLNPSLQSEVNEACLDAVAVLACSVEYVAAAGTPLPVLVCVRSGYTGATCSLMTDYQDPLEHYLRRTFGASHARGLGHRRINPFLRGCLQDRKRMIRCGIIGGTVVLGLGGKTIDWMDD